MRRAVASARWALRLGGYTTIGLVVGIAVAAAAPRAIGWQTHSVMSGSMSPTIATGDVVVSRPVPASRLHAGAVVTFRDPIDPSRLMTHRLQQLETIAGTTRATTRGDANTGIETWEVPAGGTVGVVVYRLPRVGYLLHLAGSPAGRVGLVAVPSLVWGLLSLVELWRPVRRRVTTSVVLARSSRADVLRALPLPAPRIPGAAFPAPVRLALPAGPRPLAALLPGPATPLALPVSTSRLLIAAVRDPRIDARPATPWRPVSAFASHGWS